MEEIKIESLDQQKEGDHEQSTENIKSSAEPESECTENYVEVNDVQRKSHVSPDEQELTSVADKDATELNTVEKSNNNEEKQLPSNPISIIKSPSGNTVTRIYLKDIYRRFKLLSPRRIVKSYRCRAQKTKLTQQRNIPMDKVLKRKHIDQLAENECDLNKSSSSGLSLTDKVEDSQKSCSPEKRFISSNKEIQIGKTTITRITEKANSSSLLATEVTVISDDSSDEEALTNSTAGKKKPKITCVRIAHNQNEILRKTQIFRKVRLQPSKRLQNLSKVRAPSTVTSATNILTSPNLTIERLSVSNPDKSAPSTPVASTPNPVPSMIASFNKVRLLKSSDGTYQIVNSGPSPSTSSPQVIPFISNVKKQNDDQLNVNESAKSLNPIAKVHRTPLIFRKQPPLANPHKMITSPSTFPKAITYTDYEKKKLLQQNSITPEPEIIAEISSVTDKKDTETFSETPTSPNINEDHFMNADDDEEVVKVIPDATHESNVHKESTTTQIKVTKIDKQTSSDPEKTSNPETFTYLIPQDMLASPTDRVKKQGITPLRARQLQSAPKTIIDPATYKEGDLFVIEQDEEKKSVECSPHKRRRKSVLVPKKETDVDFEEPPFDFPPRPAVNVELIESLAKYRVLVRLLMKNLNMPPIDFTEDSDEYINMYKIYRN